MVPEAALVPSEEARYVFRIAGDRVERRQVHIGLRRSGKVEVLDGLADGDQVVVAGLQKISDGALVRIVPSAAAKAAAAANGS